MVQAYWLVHRPPTSTALMLSLRVLHALAGEAGLLFGRQPSVVTCFSCVH